MNCSKKFRAEASRAAGCTPSPCVAASGGQGTARPTQKGIALVITLIMLSVITFMAITFLAVSTRERGTVTVANDQTTARLAADAGLDRAKIELVSTMLANTNGQLFDLLVSTNYITAGGFITGLTSVTNVNYNYPDGSPLDAQDMQVNAGNLLFNPRAPVFVTTNTASTNTDFRFYLDLNRNGQYDPSGLLPVVGPGGEYYNANGGTYTGPIQPGTLSNYFTGDPEWIGVLANPMMPHSSTNRFVARFAFIAVPAGKTLDMNFIHNQALSKSVDVGAGYPYNGGYLADGYMRNEGVGTWEINLAAFLTDLNTNLWDPSADMYTYYAPSNNVPTYPAGSQGRGFEDAFDVLRFRYANYYTNLSPVYNPPSGGIFNTNSFIADDIDEYDKGPMLISTSNVVENAALGDEDPVGAPWPGANNPNHIFSIQDIFDPTIMPTNLATRIVSAGAQTDSYDRYTYYRMLAQLGTDTGPEVNKLNINYTNAVIYTNLVTYPEYAASAVFNQLSNVVINSGLSTNLAPWAPKDLFTAAADRMLRMYTTNWLAADPTNYIQTFNVNTPFSITNIPVWVSNRFVYTPSVHRLLQLAANICEVNCSNQAVPFGSPNATNFPNVFRPLFAKTGTNGLGSYTNVYIVGFTNIVNASDFLVTAGPGNFTGGFLPRYRDMGNPIDMASTTQWDPLDMVDGVPLVIGARKGFPNFNELASMNVVSVARHLEFRRKDWATGGPADDPSNPVRFTNQLYEICVSNVMSMEAWNSYSNTYPRNLAMICSNVYSVSFFQTNTLDNFSWSNGTSLLLVTNIAAGTWEGFPQNGSAAPGIEQAPSFRVPFTNVTSFQTNVMFIPNYPNPVTGGGDVESPGFDSIVGYRQSVPQPTGPPFTPFPLPRWYTGATNRFRYVLVDTDANRIVDYVSLLSQDSPIDVTATLQADANGVANNNDPERDPSDGGEWNTNTLGNPVGLPVGMLNQILVSAGLLVPTSGFNNYQGVTSVPDQVNFFSYNMFGTIPYPNLAAPTKTNIFDAFTPYRTIYQYDSLQANDPLVHYNYSDLVDLTTTNSAAYVAKNPILQNIGFVNDRYEPWGKTKKGAADPNPAVNDAYFNPANKDPLITRSDDWNFPTNVMPNIGWLGKIHRGTPWQTVYMKSTDVDTNQADNIVGSANPDWRNWVGNANVVDALRERPVEDFKLFDLFTAAPDDNAGTGQLSVNQSGLAAWSAVLSGVITVTNTTPEPIISGRTVLTTSPWTIEPAGYAGTNSALGRIVTGINATRAGTIAATNFGFNGTFQHAGDVLATPELTVNSPYLNQSGDQALYGISDAMYERIPQQIMGLVRLGQPRFVIYSYGQTLRPALHSIVTTGPNFGLCTNYQITAEVATRTVVRVDGAPKPGDTNSTPHLVIESFNILPPD